MSKALSSGIGGAVIVIVARLGATGRLPRNPVVGVRIPSTMRSDEAWEAGHRASAMAMTAAGAGQIAVAALVMARHPEAATEKRLRRLAKFWTIGLIGLATYQANQAAQAIAAS